MIPIGHQSKLIAVRDTGSWVDGSWVPRVERLEFTGSLQGARYWDLKILPEGYDRSGVAFRLFTAFRLLPAQPGDREARLPAVQTGNSKTVGGARTSDMPPLTARQDMVEIPDEPWVQMRFDVFEVNPTGALYVTGAARLTHHEYILVERRIIDR